MVEVLADEHLHRCHDGILIHNHGTDHGLLRLKTVGHNPLYQCLFHEINLLLLFYNMNGKCSRYLRMKPDGNLCHAEASDRLRKLHLFLVELHAELLLCRCRNLLRGNRSEGTSTLAGFHLDRNFLIL